MLTHIKCNEGSNYFNFLVLTSEERVKSYYLCKSTIRFASVLYQPRVKLTSKF